MSLESLVTELTHSASFSSSFDGSHLRRRVWSRDASHYQIMPESTVRAKGLQDISEILAAASRHGVPVTFRSGGSSLSGQTLGRGLVIDVRSAFQKVISIDAGKVTVEPGATIALVNGYLMRQSRKLGPDPASLIVSTVGGAVSNNSSGMSCGVERNSYASLVSATVVLADGYILDGKAPDADKRLMEDRPQIARGLTAIRDDLRSDSQLAATIRRQFKLKNTMGYALQSFLDFDSPVDILLHLMVGSQGTLGFLGEIELETFPVYSHTSTTVLVFDSLESASKSLKNLAQFKASAIELLDSGSLRALNSEKLLPEPLTKYVDGSSVLFLVDIEAENAEEEDYLSEFLSTQFSGNLVISKATGADRTVLWKARKGLYAVVAKNRPAGTTALLEDVVVPTENLVPLCNQLSDLCQEFSYHNPVFFGHVRDGNVHFMISDDFSTHESTEKLGEFTERMVDIVLSLEGNLKAEHGSGRAMAPFVERQFGSELFSTMREIKMLLDPEGILNPGVIFSQSAQSHLENVKAVPKVHTVIDSCVECGFCESSCPSAGVTLTPRERIVAARELGIEALLETGIESKKYRYEIEQTCAVDGMCSVNCPVSINTGTFVKDMRGRAHAPATRSVAFHLEKHWGAFLAFGRLGLKFASRVPSLALSFTQIIRTLAPKGSFPLYQRNLPSIGFRRSRLARNGGDFVFLPSCLNSLFGDKDLDDFLDLAASHGIRVMVPKNLENFCCGTPFSSKGFHDAALWRFQRNGQIMAEFEGMQLIIDGSSCHQTLSIGASADVWEITSFINQVLGHIPVKTRHRRIILHPTCSGENTGSNEAMAMLAQRIADEVVIPVAWKCCGFAGDRGLLVPELTQHATSAESEELKGLAGIRVSNNQPCGIALSQASGVPYRSIVSAWLEAVR